MSAPAGVPPDAGARATALDPARSFLVEAPAGSGKTTLLIQRFLTLLARVPRPEALLAITFTRKAAAEMRAKVVEALARAAADDPPRHAADAATLALARAALAIDAERGWQLARQPGRLRIETIDAFNHSLVRRLPVLSRAGASLVVSERPRELYLAAARRTIAELDRGRLTGALTLVLGHLDNEVDNLERLLAGMLERRDAWLRHVLPLPGRDSEAALRAWLEECLQGLIAQGLRRAAAALPDAERAEFWRLVSGAAARHPEQGPGARTLAALAPGAGPAPLAAALPAWQAATRIVMTQGGQLRARLDKTCGFPPEAKADKAAFAALLARLAGAEGFVAAFARVATLPPPAYDAAQWPVLMALREVLLHAAQELAVLFATGGEVDHPAVQRAAVQALGAPDEPTDLTLELDERLQHVLVDEFQDTSAAQVELLVGLTAGWQPGDGRTLFAVGDPMQSIYGFREADVGLFLMVKREGIGALRLEHLRLTANFRSQPVLVDWFNATFPRVLAPAEELARGAVPYAPAAAVREPQAGAAVELHLLEGVTLEAEAREAARLIAAERARFPELTVAVLAPARTALGRVAQALDAAGLRFEGVNLVPLAERPAVRDLIALTRALAHPADRIAWLSCLRAPWCGLELAALAELAADSPDAPIPALWRDEPRLARLPAAARERLLAARAVLEAGLAERGRRPLAATVEATWCALGGPATLADAAALEDAAAFFAKLAALEQGADLEEPVRLDEALADLYAAPASGADPRLQLLTVHGAKGLEWDIVVLVGLGRGGRPESRALLNWLEFARPGAELGLVLAPRAASASASDPLEAWLRGLADERRALEQGRIAYVAATRAKRRLLLVGNVKDGEPKRGTLLASFAPALEGIDGRSLPAASGGGAVRAAVLRRHRAGWRPPPPDPEVVPLAEPPPPAGPAEFEFEWVGTVARHVGTVVHEELERAARPGQPFPERRHDERRWRRRLGELGLASADLPRALERIGHALESTRADERGRWLFDPAHREAASELELSGLVAGRVVQARIDRTFIDAGGVRWIVDYKTSVHEGADVEAFLDQERERYAAQLEAYAALLRAQDPGREIGLGLYFPMLTGWRAWTARR